MRSLSLLALCLTLTGCSTMTHELQPHRLWRWNYQESAGRTDGALFSVDDPLVPKPVIGVHREMKCAAQNPGNYSVKAN